MLLIALVTSLLFPPAPQTVTVSLSSSANTAGDMHLAVYATDEAFKSKTDLVTLIEASTDGNTEIAVTLPGPGRYVLAAYHDVNGNGKLDKSFFGAPAEPYGFTEVPPSKWRAPTFAEISTEFNGGTTAASIALKRWKEY